MSATATVKLGDSVYVDNVADLRRFLKVATYIFIQVRFGTSEKWVKLSKKEALLMVASLNPTTTPQDAEMYSGHFGEWYPYSKSLYLG